ncbi:MAG: hypothetical protein COV67_00190 [Nitrospinae bacterium CG11_big_fil_rev_8_21_14_0_20_56_8]|nr:MAG: hypothetical protein COV67_00190 [Nitrospinae bacterium CG11_big_fil_rev_8_21_14_0_20_56_8]
MQFMEDEICQYTVDIWKQILGLEVHRTQEEFLPDGSEGTLSGCVQIMGSWDGTVMLTCPLPLARKAAAIMFGTNEETASKDEIQDALGELANMTGGNIKSLLHTPEQECYLSLPAVAVANQHLRVPGSEQVTQITFQHQNHRFVVSLLKKAAGKERAK